MQLWWDVVIVWPFGCKQGGGCGKGMGMCPLLHGVRSKKMTYFGNLELIGICVPSHVEHGGDTS